jgi:hypothetical protein
VQAHPLSGLLASRGATMSSATSLPGTPWVRTYTRCVALVTLGVRACACGAIACPPPQHVRTNIPASSMQDPQQVRWGGVQEQAGRAAPTAGVARRTANAMPSQGWCGRHGEDDDDVRQSPVWHIIGTKPIIYAPGETEATDSNSLNRGWVGHYLQRTRVGWGG